jgi:hypothetical protein
LLEQWNVGATLTERRVVHVVLDTEAVDPTERAQLFIDGSLVDPVVEEPPSMGEGITLDIDRHYVLGNRQIGGRTFEGTMFYAALYDSALTLDEVADHAAVLAAFDDAP